MFDVNEHLLFLKLIEQHLCQELPKISTIISLPLNSLKTESRIWQPFTLIVSFFKKQKSKIVLNEQASSWAEINCQEFLKVPH